MSKFVIVAHGTKSPLEPSIIDDARESGSGVLPCVEEPLFINQNGCIELCYTGALGLTGPNNCLFVEEPFPEVDFCGAIKQYVNNEWGVYRSPGITEVTVGFGSNGVSPGANYTTVTNALLDSNTFTNCKFIRITDSVDEGADLNLTSDVLIYIDPGVNYTVSNINLNDHNLVLFGNENQNSSQITISGQINGSGILSLKYLRVNHTGTLQLLNTNLTSIKVQTCTFDMGSSTAPIFSGVIPKTCLQDVEILNATNTQIVADQGSDIDIHNLKLINSQSTPLIQVNETNVRLSEIEYNSADDSSMILNCQVLNLKETNSGMLDLSADMDNFIWNNVNVSGSTTIGTGTGVDATTGGMVNVLVSSSLLIYVNTEGGSYFQGSNINTGNITVTGENIDGKTINGNPNILLDNIVCNNMTLTNIRFSIDKVRSGSILDITGSNKGEDNGAIIGSMSNAFFNLCRLDFAANVKFANCTLVTVYISPLGNEVTCEDIFFSSCIINQLRDRGDYTQLVGCACDVFGGQNGWYMLLGEPSVISGCNLRSRLNVVKEVHVSATTMVFMFLYGQYTAGIPPVNTLFQGGTANGSTFSDIRCTNQSVIGRVVVSAEYDGVSDIALNNFRTTSNLVIGDNAGNVGNTVTQRINITGSLINGTLTLGNTNQNLDKITVGNSQLNNLTIQNANDSIISGNVVRGTTTHSNTSSGCIYSGNNITNLSIALPPTPPLFTGNISNIPMNAGGGGLTDINSIGNNM